MHELEALLLNSIYFSDSSLPKPADIIKKMQECKDDPKPDINVKDPLTGNNALMIAAARKNNKDQVEMLIKAGAKLDLQNNGLKTALFYAAERGHLPNLEILLDAGADSDMKNVAGRTALMIAVLSGREDVVDKLLSKGALTEIQDEFGNTAFDLAINRNRYSIAILLLQFGAQIGNLPAFEAALDSLTGPQWETYVSMGRGICYRNRGEINEAKKIYNKNQTGSVPRDRMLRALILGESFSNLDELVACKEQMEREIKQEDVFDRSVADAVRIEKTEASASRSVLFPLPDVDPLEEEKMVHGRKSKSPGMPGMKTS